MGAFTVGRLTSVPVASATASPESELVAAPTLAALERLDLLGDVGVVEIDPELSDTAQTQEAYDLPPDSLANCVVVAGKREGVEKVAACMVLATTRADVNNVVRRRLDVRKATFLGRDDVVERTGMEYGGITAIGLPDDWRVLVDAAVASAPVLVIGSGVRRSKLLLPGSVLADLPTAETVESLGR
jgi:prolyl-tRNA editing enzyme YbaK/EbsC (Cys-tRNA(Pro) deacylase)